MKSTRQGQWQDAFKHIQAWRGVARRRNIRNAFGIKEQKQQQIQDRHIALVDDVAGGQWWVG
ncbi:MAG: hypothetical protein ACYYK0_02560 [Candidatus Eutrophobiaceae bacterium]